MSLISSVASSNVDVKAFYDEFLEKPIGGFPSGQLKPSIKHSEFGYCNNPNWRWTSQVGP